MTATGWWTRRRIIVAALVVGVLVIGAVLTATWLFQALQRGLSDVQLSMDAGPETSETIAATSGWHTLVSMEGSGSRRTGFFKVSGDRVAVRLSSTDPNGSEDSSALFALLSANPLRIGYMRNVFTQPGGGETAVVLEVPPGWYHATVQGFGPWKVVVLEP